jgi:hypothetical protein
MGVIHHATRDGSLKIRLPENSLDEKRGEWVYYMMLA